MMNSSQFMDKQIMDLAGSSSTPGSAVGGGELFDLINPQEDLHRHGGSSNNGIGVTKEEMLPSYDFQPIRAAGSANHGSGTNLDGVARSWGSADSKLGSVTARYSSILEPHEQPKVSQEMNRDAYDVATVREIDRTVKKYADNLLHTLEGVSARLLQLENRTHHLETSVDELKITTGNHGGSTDGKMRQLENILREVQTSVQVLRDKQEIADAQIQHLSNKDQPPKPPPENPKESTSQQAPPQPSYQPPPQPSYQPPPPPHPSYQPPAMPPQPSVSSPQPPAVSSASPQYQGPSPTDYFPQGPPPPPQPSYQPPPPPQPSYQPPAMPPQPSVSAPQPPAVSSAPPQYQGPSPTDYFPQGPPPHYQLPQYPQQMPPQHDESAPYMPPPQTYPQNIRPPLSSYGPQSDPAYPYNSGSPSHYSKQQPPLSKSTPPLPRTGSGTSSYRLPTAKLLPHAEAPGGSSGNVVPVDDVVEKVATMGFSREQVRAAVKKLTENGQSVDLNVVLDKLMNEGGGGDMVQPQKGWFGR